MHIKEILKQHRRDFTAIYICEHCDNEEELIGYDDEHFHRNVIPKIECGECGERASDSYRPLAPRYSDGFTI